MFTPTRGDHHRLGSHSDETSARGVVDQRADHFRAAVVVVVEGDRIEKPRVLEIINPAPSMIAFHAA